MKNTRKDLVYRGPGSKEIWKVTENNVEMADHAVRPGWTKISSEASRGLRMPDEKT